MILFLQNRRAGISVITALLLTILLFSCAREGYVCHDSQQYSSSSQSTFVDRVRAAQKLKVSPEAVEDQVGKRAWYNSERDTLLKLKNFTYSYRSTHFNAFPDFEAALHLVIWDDAEAISDLSNGLLLIGLIWCRDGEIRLIELESFL